MNKIDQLSLNREDIIARLSGALTFSQATIALFGKDTSLNHRERKLFKKKYDIDIALIVAQNKEHNRIEKKRIEDNRIFVCECCGNNYRNGDHHCDNKSGRHFCSNSCARKYSANSKTERSRLKTSESLKRYYKEHTHTLKCEKCGKEFKASLTLTHGKCKECIDKAQKFGLSKSQAKRRKICKICGAIHGTCSRSDICKNTVNTFTVFSKLFGFDMTMLGSEKAYAEFDRIKTMLYDLYWNKGMSVPDLFNMFKEKAKTSYLTGTGNFIKLLKLFIKLRTPINGIKLRISKHQCKSNSQFGILSTTHTSWNKKHFVYRSSYELDLCHELDAGKINYIMEPFTIDYYDTSLKHKRFAVPDFYLPEYNMIIEVKSKFTYDRQNMIDKAKAYIEQGYNFILEYEHKSYTFQDMLKNVFDIKKNITYYKTGNNASPIVPTNLRISD